MQGRLRAGALTLAVLGSVAVPVAPGAAAPPAPGSVQGATTEPPPAVTAGPAPVAPPPAYVPDELLVRFEPRTAEGERARVRRQHGLERLESLPFEGMELVRSTRQRPLPEQAADVAREQSVRHAEPNTLAHATATPTDPMLPTQWGVHNDGVNGWIYGTADADIDGPEAWGVAPAGEQVVVGVIDEGVDITHPDLVDNIWLNAGELPPPTTDDGNGYLSIADYATTPDHNGNGYLDPDDLVIAYADGVDGHGPSGADDGWNTLVDDITGWDFANDDRSVYDEADGDDHGTHVAGTIAATWDAYGVAGVSQARLMPLKFLGPTSGSFDDAISAIGYAVGAGAHLTSNSWGCQEAPGRNCYYSLLHDAVADAMRAGQLFVAAAGNAGVDTDTPNNQHYPSGFAFDLDGDSTIDPDGLVSVASTDPDDLKSSFSNYGATSVDLGAPGTWVNSTVPRLPKAVVVDPTTDGSVGYRAATHAYGLEDLVTGSHTPAVQAALSTFAGLPTSASLLVVDDDGGAIHETLWATALDALGYTTRTVVTVPSGGNGPSAATMGGYDAVVWLTGTDATTSLTATDRSELTAYLQSTAGPVPTLLLFGSNLAQDLAVDGTGAEVDDAFLEGLLRVEYTATADWQQYLAGENAYSGLSLTLNENGAGRADAISPRDGADAAVRGASTHMYYSGTSMATPHVAGAAAVLLATDPTLTPFTLKDRLLATGDPVTSMSGITTSGARLNLRRAVNAVPTAVDDTAATTADQAVTIPVLDNDTDPDGDTLTVIDWYSEGGSLEEPVDCTAGTSCTYTPPAGFTGTHVFNYYTADGWGGLSGAGVVTVTVTEACVQVDTEPNDTPAQATVTLQSGVATDGSLCGEDVDVFMIEATAGETITATLTYDPADDPLTVELLSPTETSLASTAGTNGEATATATANETGTYYVSVSGLTEGSPSTLYQVLVQRGWVGDFNGDGFADLAVGMPDADVGTLAAAGEIGVVYGSAAGLSSSGSQVLRSWTALARPNSGGARFGSVLSAGDFNGDGFADLAVGMPDADVGTLAAAGEIGVVYGSAAGLSSSGSQVLRSWTALARPNSGGARFGSVLSAGDFNGDGFADLAVGMPDADVGTLAAAGEIGVVYGSAAGLSSSGSQVLRSWTALARPNSGGARFGSVLSAGDFNGDGFADLAVGMPDADVGTLAAAGEIGVVYGSAAGLSSSGSQVLRSWTALARPNSGGARFGSVLSAGDFNGDGFADLAVGMPDADVGTLAAAGEIGVVYGSAAGLSSSGSQVLRSWTALARPNSGGARFGSVLSAGDFNGDGFADLAVGMPDADVGTLAAAGEIGVVYGSAAGLSSSGSQVLRSWTELARPNSGGARFGSVLAR